MASGQHPVQDLHFISNPKTELREIFLNLFINNFALSLFSIFITVFLLELNYSIYTVILFMIEFYLVWLIVSIPTAKLVSKIGKKKVVMLSAPLALIQLFAIYNLKKIPSLLYVIPIFWAIAKSLYWLPLNAHFSENSNKHKVGKNTSSLILAARLGAIFGPTIGGLIATQFSFNILFLIAGIILAISVYPLFKTKDEKDYLDVNLKEVFKKNIKFFDAFFIEGLFGITFFVFLNIHIYYNSSLLGLGIINTISMLLGFVLTYFIGAASDKLNKIKMIRLGALIMGLIWLGLAFATDSFLILALGSVFGLFSVILGIPLFALVVSKRTKKDSLEFMTLREMALKVGACCGLLPAFFIPQEYLFQGMFIIAAIATFYLMFLKLEKRVKA